MPMTVAVAPTHTLGRTLLELADGLSGALLGFLFYGGWAIWANSDHGMAIALRAGAIQGTMSFIVTLSGTTLMKALFIGHAALWVRFLRASIGALVLIYSLIISVHLLNGTPNILLTLAPGLPITIFFCLSYCYGLMRYGIPEHSLQLLPRNPD